MYAIIETGGKQYRVEEGTKVKVELLPNSKGDQITLDKVLMVSTDAGVKLGNPSVGGAVVSAEVIAVDRAPKILVFKKRSKKTYKKTIGHRQYYTELLVKSITA